MSGLFDDVLIPSTAGSSGLFDDVLSPPKQQNQSDFMRGGKEAFQQLPQLGYGLIAGAGAAAESAFGDGGIASGIKKAGVKGYKEWGDKIAKDSKPSDSWDYSYDKAKEGDFGSLVDWLQHGLGYVAGQGIQTLATGGIGAVGGKFVAGTAAKQIAEGMVSKEAARLGAENAALAVGERAASDAILKAATANVAAKFAAIGQSAAIGANAFGMEGGEIFGDLTSSNQDRALTGSELGKAFASTLAAGGLEFVGDKVGLDIMLGKSKLLKPAEGMKGIVGRVARGGIAAAGAAPIESGTEYAQTLAEEYGKGNDPFSDASFKQAREAAMLGALGGTAMGGAGGALRGAKESDKPAPSEQPTNNPLQLGNTPDPLIGFPDGTVARRSEIEAHIASLPEDQQIAARARLSGFAPQKATIADIGAAPNMDDAIAAFTQVVSAPVDLAPDISDAQEFADLVQSEARNQQVMLAQMDQDRIKQAQLDQIPAIAAEQNVTQEALQRAAALDAPTAMGSAFSKLFDKTIGAEPEARETAPAPVPAPKPVPEPRIVARDPGMLAMPRELAELRATMNGGEVVRVQNQNGKFAYTVLEDGSKPSLARVANAAPPASVVDQRLTPVSKRTESTNEKAPEAIQSSAQRPQAPAATGPSKSAASAGVAATDETGGAPSPVEVSRYTGKFGKGMGKDAARLEAQRLNRAADGITYAAEEHNDPKLENPYAVVGRKDFAQPENKPKQAGSPAERAQAVTETVAPKKAKKPKGGQTLRAAAYDKNPLMTFLATHGLFHDKAQPNSHKSEFSPDKGIMVMGYGPVFKKTGKRLDVLTQNAIEEGYLPKDGTEAQLRELVRRAVAGEKISPMYAQGVAEQLAEQSFAEHLAQQQEAAQDDDYDPFQPLDELGYEIEDALSAGRSDLTPALQNEVDALLLQAEDVGIDIDQIKSDAATETEKGSQDDYLSATKQRLEAAITGRAANSNGGSTEQDGGQGRGQATVTGSAESRGENDDRQEQSGSQEGLTSPTREDVLAQQDRAAAATKAEAQAATESANKAKADAERNEFTLTGSDRAADVGAAGGQQDIFAEPAAQATAILDAANVTGKERIDVLKDVKKGDITPDELQAAYPAKEPAAKIEDAGAKIGGARKDKWKDRGLDLTDLDGMSESEGAELATKANVWKPDYEAMAEATEPVTAAMVKTVYDQLAAQPKKNTPEGRRNYVTMMQAVRKAYSEAKSPEDVKQAGDKVKRAIGLYTDDAEAKKLAREVLFSVYKGRSDPFVLGYNELSKAKKLVEDGFPAKGEPWKKRLSIRDYGGNGITSRGIELTLKESAELGTPLTTDQIVSGFFRISNKDGKAVGYAPTKADAEATAKTIYERDLKKGPADKAEPTRPNLDALKREGLPTRTDRDVSANDFVKDFGFRGVEFGNWAAQDERQRIINMAYDGLKDLAEIMGLPPKALSLNGTMGMAFGARGGGKFSAHYEPGKLVINMTKINGGGSMAHEWAHALDHYFGELNQKDAYTTKARGASGWYDEQQYKGLPRTRMEKDAEGKWANVTKMRLDNMRPEMAKAFDDVMSALFSGQETKAQMVRSEELAIERYQALADKETDPEMKAVYLRGIESRKQSLEELRKDPEDKTYPKGRSGYASEAQKLVGKSATGYWTRPTEMFARAFESWVFDKVAAMGAKSDYLVHGVEEDRFSGGNYKGNPYPTGPERATINAAFDKLASTIQTKETDKGVAMFSRAQSETEALQAISENDDLFQYEKSDKNTVEGVAKDINPAITVRKLSNIPGETRYILTTPDGNTHRMMVRPFNPYADKETGTLYGYNLDKNNEMTDVVMERPGKNSEAVEGKDDVYIDVSLMQPGQYGAQIYSIAQNYAHNAGKIFIGDPAGLSDKAMKRRVENMLSSALKFGTTEHLAPHPRQVKGDSSIGVPALDWTYGDDLANIKSLVNVSNAIYGPSNPVTFEPRTGQFLDSEGGVLDDDAISLIDGIRRTGKDGVGLSTAKRNAVLSAILREESQANGGNGSTGRGLLDRLMEVGVQYPVSTRGIFYSRGERSNTGLTPTQFTAELSKAFGSKVAEKLQAKGVVVPLADQSKLPAHVVPFLRDGDIIYGFYDPKTDRTYAVLENLTSEMVKGLTLHEVGVHYGFKSMLGDAKYANVMQRLDVMRRAGSKTVKEAYAQAKANAVRDSQVAEETLAYLVQTAPEMSLVKEIIARIKAFLYTEFGIGGKYLNEADLTMLARAAVDHASRLEDGGSTVPAFMREGGKPDKTDTEAFKKWFGDSKVVDAEGNPLVVYHGTAVDFDSFDNAKTGANDRGMWGRGHYFAASAESANSYALRQGDGARVIPAYVSIKNPLVLKTGSDLVTRLPDGANVKELVGQNLDGAKVKAMALAGGHDGVIQYRPNGLIGDVVAYSPEQIKSATGNNGDFDGTNPDIRFSRSGVVGQTARQHTPEQLRAMKNVGFDVEAPTLKERAQALWKDAGKKLAQGIVDQFAPVKDLDKNAYGLLRLAKGASGAFEAFLQGGKLKLTDGVYDFDDANKGGVIDKLLIPLQGEHHDFMRWVAANRAERLQGEGKENLFSAQDIADLKTLASGTADFDYTVQTGPAKGRVTRDRTLIYADANRVFNEFNKNVLDMAEQSGLIDGASRKVWEHEFYVPFYRVADEDGGGVRGMSVKGSVLRQQAFKELKGGKNALNADLLDNTLMNWAHLLDASAKNRAAKATIEAAERMGVATGGDQATLAQMGASIHNKHGVVWFMDGGQKRYSLIDKEGDGPYLMTAINALEYAGMRNPVMNAMGAMKHALTVGVTASPFFKIRNLIRDSVQAIGTGNLSYNPAKNITEGWKLTDPKSDAYFRLLAGGGTIHFGTMLEGSEAKRVQALVESGVDDATILGDDRKVKAFYRKYIEPGITAYSELGNRGEAINRASLYDQLRKQGVNHADASLQARDLMDFSMQGSFTSIRFLTQVVPFLNARLQGLYKLGRAAKEDPARFSMVLGSVAAISLGLLAAYSDDDDWKKREDWDRNNFWWFKVGGTAFRIPKPFEIGAIATLAERGFELAFDKEMTNKRFMGQVMTLLGDNLSMNPVPQLVKPMLDVYANKDSFSGRPIETMGMEKLKSEYRFTDRTSMAARAASTSLNAVTGLVGKEALSPVQIDSMLRGYFGWLGSFIVGAGDKIARPATDQKDQASPDYWKVATGSIVSDLGDAPSRYVSAMYDQAKTLEEAYGTYRMLVKEGKTEEAKEFMVDHRDELTRYKRVEAVKRTEAKFNERIRMIERSALSSDAKRDAIRKVKEQKDRVARQLAPA